MNPLLNAHLGQAAHREYEAKFGRRNSFEEKEVPQSPLPIKHKLALVAGTITTLIAIASLFLAG